MNYHEVYEKSKKNKQTNKNRCQGGALSVVGNAVSDSSSNPKWGGLLLNFTLMQESIGSLPTLQP